MRQVEFGARIAVESSVANISDDANYFPRDDVAEYAE
jgi:hypothetical protein